MNVQDAKDLHITEGDVRTIHDSSGKQLWGRLNYDTKYAGDTFQQTYTGKNLFNKNLPLFPTSTTSSITAEVLETGIKVQQTIASTANLYATYILGDFSSFAGQSVTLSCNIFTSGQNIARLALGYCKSDGSSRSTRVYIYGSSGQTTLELSASELAERPYLYIYAYSNAGGGDGQAGDYVEYTNLQLEIGSTATSYEPYVGGIPAPNPDYPQDVKVVTGVQTISITGGTVSKNFTLDLGNNELCKIGTYQDYIYKSGDDWYVHKATDKVVFTGASSEGWWGGSSGIKQVPLPNTSVYGEDLYSNYFIKSTSTEVVGSAFIYAIGYIRFITPYTSVSDWQTWLGTHNTSLYYPLATATDTQITDATLLGQLNAVHEWLTRYGYSSTVTGNLPIIINQTTLS